MSTAEIILRLTAVAILGAYLFYRHLERIRRLMEDDAERRFAGGTAPSEEWNGHGFDTAQVRPRLELLRHDYLAERPAARGRRFLHGGLITKARRKVCGLAYFRGRPDDRETVPLVPLATTGVSSNPVSAISEDGTWNGLE
jgi:hypothetical protein